MLINSNHSTSTDADDEMTVHQYVGKWESVTPFAANPTTARESDKNVAGQTGMVMLQVLFRSSVGQYIKCRVFNILCG